MGIDAKEEQINSERGDSEIKKNNNLQTKLDKKRSCTCGMRQKPSPKTEEIQPFWKSKDKSQKKEEKYPKTKKKFSDDDRRPKSREFPHLITFFSCCCRI